MTAENIIVIALIGYIRKRTKSKDEIPEMDKVLLGLFFLSIGLLVIDAIFVSEAFTRWFMFLIVSGVIYLVYQNEELKLVRTVTYSIIPFYIVSIISSAVKLISSDLYDIIDNYIQTAHLLALLWIFAMMYQNNKQVKAEKKAEQLRLIELDKQRILEGKKEQLEYQVAERTQEIMQQKEELQVALSELRATQTQLIHHEKMASLGELTAGIAHEIQNPLNFVNNFSEVSIELLDEMETEIAGNNLEEVIAISQDIKQNLAKIAQHGKRADAIVKGMLQHSRSSSGTKEPADINAIADEYLRLSYHGLRAKDKSFNALFKTDFDPHIGLINMVAQDVGRVLLNLFNNGFYSVDKKKKDHPEGYSPELSVSTKKTDEGVLIKVRDNGYGISQEALEKIYQPFFTTKPTGEGTGLGLSMSYDIITKGHRGTITVDNKEGEYAEFQITIPFQ
ncbi:MAG: ATP-binding protein [Pelobium sp.]